MHGNLRVPGAYRRWQQYRWDVTEYITAECRYGERILILGAGGCDDLDLDWLLQRETEVWLCDINVSAMQEAVVELLGQKPEYKSRLHWIETDLIALTEQALMQYDTACSEGIESLRLWWEKYMQFFAEKTLMMRDIQRSMQKAGISIFDKVICLGVHSQLYSPLAVRTYQHRAGLSENVRACAVHWLQQANEAAAEKFFYELPLLGRQLYLGLEYTTIHAEESAMEAEILFRLGSYGEDGLQGMNLSRVEGAWQTEQEMQRQADRRKLIIQDRQYLIWPFSEEKRYLMVIYSLLCYNGQEIE